MDIDSYSPGVHKLIHHHEHLSKIDKGEITGPLHVSIFPNTKCQLNCPYCCFNKTNRENIELSLSDFCMATDILKKYGLKAMEFSGGGEPLWSHW